MYRFVVAVTVILFLQVLNICIEMMDEVIPNERAARDFRVKFPDDVMQENLAGQLWFGAEVRVMAGTCRDLSNQEANAVLSCSRSSSSS